MKELNITNLEALNIVAWYKQLSEDAKNEIPFKIRWALKRAIAKFEPTATDFDKFREEELGKIQNEFFNEEKSYEAMLPKLDANGNEEKDEDGNVLTVEGRKIKEEYMQEYNNEIAALNKKLNEILMEKSTYEFNGVAMDDYVDELENATHLKFNDIEMLDAILNIGEA